MSSCCIGGVKDVSTADQYDTPADTKIDISPSERLTRTELWRLRAAWRLHVAADPVEFFTIFCERAMARSHPIKELIQDGGDINNHVTHKRVVDICRRVAVFNVKIYELMMKRKFTEAHRLLFALGAKHFYFGGSRPFQPIYWDIFVTGATQAMEAAGGKPAHIQIIQKYLQVLVAGMRKGYHDEEEKQPERQIVRSP